MTNDEHTVTELFDTPSPQAEKRPLYCGSGHCSCIECHFPQAERVPLSVAQVNDIYEALNEKHWAFRHDFAHDIVDKFCEVNGIVTK